MHRLHILPLPLHQDLLPPAGLHRQAAQVHWGGELRLRQSWGTENILTIEIFLTHKIIFKFLCFLKSTLENIHPWSEGCGKFCPKLLHTHNDSDISWRCQGGINPYKEDIPAGTPCYTQSVSLQSAMSCIPFLMFLGAVAGKTNFSLDHLPSSPFALEKNVGIYFERGRHQSPPSLQFGLILSEDCIILIRVFNFIAFRG